MPDATCASTGVSNFVAVASVIVAGLALLVNLLFQILAHKRERDKIRFGIVYREQFRVCKELYTRLSRLRDAVEYYADPQIDDDERRRRRSKLDSAADAFRRSFRQNDAVLDEALATEVATAWKAFKDSAYLFADADRGRGDILPSAARTDLLEALDGARVRTRPLIRRAYSIEQS